MTVPPGRYWRLSGAVFEGFRTVRFQPRRSSLAIFRDLLFPISDFTHCNPHF